MRAAGPPARGVAAFEKSAFCKKYACALSGPIEPLRMFGVIQEYFYNYRASLPDKTPLAGQFGMRLSTTGERTDPYIIVRWVPVTTMTDKDVVGINELVGEITGVPAFDAAQFVLDFAKARAVKPDFGPGPKTVVGKFNVYCTYTPAKKTQVTLLLEKIPEP